MRLFAGILQTSEIPSNLSYCFHTGEVAGSIGHRPLPVLRPISEDLGERYETVTNETLRLSRMCWRSCQMAARPSASPPTWDLDPHRPLPPAQPLPRPGRRLLDRGPQAGGRGGATATAERGTSGPLARRSEPPFGPRPASPDARRLPVPGPTTSRSRDPPILVMFHPLRRPQTPRRNPEETKGGLPGSGPRST